MLKTSNCHNKIVATIDHNQLQIAYENNTKTCNDHGKMHGQCNRICSNRAHE